MSCIQGAPLEYYSIWSHPCTLYFQILKWTFSSEDFTWNKIKVSFLRYFSTPTIHLHSINHHLQSQMKMGKKGVVQNLCGIHLIVRECMGGGNYPEQTCSHISRYEWPGKETLHHLVVHHDQNSILYYMLMNWSNKTFPSSQRGQPPINTNKQNSPTRDSEQVLLTRKKHYRILNDGQRATKLK